MKMDKFELEIVEMDKFEMEELDMDKFELVLVENLKEEEKGSKLKRKATKVKEIATNSVKKTFKSPWTYIAVGVNAADKSLKDGNGIKEGIKAGVTTAVMVSGIGVTSELYVKRDELKDA